MSVPMRNSAIFAPSYTAANSRVWPGKASIVLRRESLTQLQHLAIKAVGHGFDSGLAAGKVVDRHQHCNRRVAVGNDLGLLLSRGDQGKSCWRDWAIEMDIKFLYVLNICTL